MGDEKRVLTMDKYDYRLLINILCDKRNELIKTNKSTSLVDELLLKVVNAPVKKFFIKSKSYEER